MERGNIMRLMAVAAAVTALCACETLQVGSSNASAQTPAATAAPVAVTGAEQQLLEAERRVAAAAQARGYGPALSSSLASDGFLVRPGQTLGPSDPAQANTPNAGPVFWQNDRVVLSRGGDMGMTSGRYVQVLPGVEAAQGRYIMVWRKDEAGEWRIVTETRVADPPRRATPAPAPARRRR
jgi:hypothetical protein